MKWLDTNRKIRPGIIGFLETYKELFKANDLEKIYEAANRESAATRDITYMLYKAGCNVFEKLGYIPESACMDDVGLFEITIPNNIEIIKDSAFEGCIQVKKVIIPESVHTIESWAFSDMYQLEEIVVKGQLQAISEYAFIQCPKLETIYSIEDNKDLLYGSVDRLDNGFCRFLVI